MPLLILEPLQLQQFHYRHLHNVENTRSLEKAGGKLLGSPQISAASIRFFCEQVCRWGGRTGSRVWGLIQKNPDSTLTTAFWSAIRLLKKKRPLEALQVLHEIKGLGGYSYSSKHLRFLAPDQVPVLDSLIDGELQRMGIGKNRDERFLKYIEFCKTTAIRLTQARVVLGDYIQKEPNGRVVSCSGRTKCRWTVGDVDMAVFWHLKTRRNR